MTEPNEYAQLLRAIGQALEILQFGSFSMEFTGGDFVVHGSAAASMEQEEGPGDTAKGHQVCVGGSSW